VISSAAKQNLKEIINQRKLCVDGFDEKVCAPRAQKLTPLSSAAKDIKTAVCVHLPQVLAHAVAEYAGARTLWDLPTLGKLKWEPITSLYENGAFQIRGSFVAHSSDKAKRTRIYQGGNWLTPVATIEGAYPIKFIGTKYLEVGSRSNAHFLNLETLKPCERSDIPPLPNFSWDHLPNGGYCTWTAKGVQINFASGGFKNIEIPRWCGVVALWYRSPELVGQDIDDTFLIESAYRDLWLVNSKETDSVRQLIIPKVPYDDQIVFWAGYDGLFARPHTLSAETPILQLVIDPD
jgi:hypothetical protein